MARLKYLDGEDLKRIFKSRVRRDPKLGDKVKFYVSNVLIKEYKYVPLSPYTDVQHTLSVIMKKEDPVNAIKELALITLSGPRVYPEINSEVLEWIKRCRWAIRVLGAPLEMITYNVYLLGEAIRRYVETKNMSEALRELTSISQEKEGFRRARGDEGYKKNVKLVDILYSSGSAAAIPSPSLISSLLKRSPYIVREFPWKLTSGTLLAYMVTSLDAKTKTFPEEWIRPEIAWATIETTFKVREWFTREYLKRDSNISPYDLLKGAEDLVINELTKNGLKRETAETVTRYIVPALIRDSSLVALYLAHYGVRTLNLVKALTEMDFAEYKK